MFNCNGCKKQSKPRERAKFIVVATRPRVYGYRPRANKVRQEDKDGRYTAHNPDNGGEGSEIVKEIKVCTRCLKKRQAEVMETAFSNMESGNAHSGVRRATS